MNNSAYLSTSLIEVVEDWSFQMLKHKIEKFKLEESNLSILINPKKISQQLKLECIEDCPGKYVRNPKICLYTKICPVNDHIGSCGDSDYYMELREGVYQFVYNYDKKQWYFKRQTISLYCLLLYAKYNLPVIIGGIQAKYKFSIHHFYSLKFYNLDCYLLGNPGHYVRDYTEDIRRLGLAGLSISKTIGTIYHDINTLINLLNIESFKSPTKHNSSKERVLDFINIPDKHRVYLKEIINDFVIKNKLSGIKGRLVSLITEINRKRTLVENNLIRFYIEKQRLDQTQEVIDLRKQMEEDTKKNIEKLRRQADIFNLYAQKFINDGLPDLRGEGFLVQPRRKNAIQDISKLVI